MLKPDRKMIIVIVIIILMVSGLRYWAHLEYLECLEVRDEWRDDPVKASEKYGYSTFYEWAKANDQIPDDCTTKTGYSS